MTDQIQARIDVDRVVWFTTVTPSGRPTPRPVWFVWEDDAFLVYSTAEAAKVRHVRTDPDVALNFNSDAAGGDVVVISGRAEVIENAAPASTVPSYLDKYRDGMAYLGLKPAEFDATYSVGLRITPTKVWTIGD